MTSQLITRNRLYIRHLRHHRVKRNQIQAVIVRSQHLKRLFSIHPLFNILKPSHLLDLSTELPLKINNRRLQPTGQ